MKEILARITVLTALTFGGGACSETKKAAPLLPTRTPKPTFTQAEFPPAETLMVYTFTPVPSATSTPEPSATLKPTDTATPFPTDTSIPPTFIPSSSPIPQPPTKEPEPVPEKHVKLLSLEWEPNCGWTGVGKDKSIVTDSNGNPVNGIIFLIENRWGFQAVTHESGVGGPYEPGRFDITLAQGQEGRFTFQPYAWRVEEQARLETSSQELLKEVQEHPEHFYFFPAEEVDVAELNFQHCLNGGQQVAYIQFQVVR